MNSVVPGHDDSHDQNGAKHVHATVDYLANDGVVASGG